MFDAIFDWCVALLVWMANTTGLTYKDINVWIFVIIWPVLLVVMAVVIVIQQHELSRIRRKIS